MRDYKKTLIENVGDVAARTYHRTRSAGLVINSDEKNNVATIRFLNRDGCFETRKNVTVRIHGDGTGWFPSKGELVAVEETDNVCEIIARYGGGFSTETRKDLITEHDIYPDGRGYMPGGYVF